MFLHREIGKGTMPDGRECRLIMTDNGVYMQVYPKDKGSMWKTFSLPWMELSEAIVSEIEKIEGVNRE